MKLLQGKAGWALLIVLALVFPYMVSNTYFLSVMTQAYIFAIAALGLSLLGVLTTDPRQIVWCFSLAFGVLGACASNS